METFQTKTQPTDIDLHVTSGPDSPPPSRSSLGRKLPVTWAATLGRGEALSTITSEGSTRDTSSNTEREDDITCERIHGGITHQVRRVI